VGKNNKKGPQLYESSLQSREIPGILEGSQPERLGYHVQSPDSELTLVQQATRHDQNAFAALYERHVERVFRHVRYMVPDRVDAEDITQDTFVKAWKSIQRYRWTGAPFVSWLIAIARNAIVDHYRSRKNLRHFEPTDDADTQPDPAMSMELRLGSLEVREAVMKLKGAKQAVIMMRFIDGFSYEEVAEALNKSEGAVRVIQHRALCELRQILAASEA
jgi:RNA polymerase sigma-70 factor (ECF subfamily)